MKIFKLYFALAVSFLTFINQTRGQTADQIIEKHIEACGGIENYNAIKDLKITGKFTAFSLEKPFEFQWFFPDKFYAEYSLGKHDVQEAFNGQTGWVIDPWQEISFPRLTNAVETNVFRQKAALISPFFRYRENNCTVEYLGMEEVEGENMHKLKLIRPDKNEETWYLRTDNYLPYKCTSRWQDFMYPTVAETFFDDYKTVSGLKIPHYTERTFGQRHRVTVIENIAVNTDSDPEIIKMPRSKEMNQLSDLHGEWTVETYVMGRDKKWHSVGNTKSEIIFDKLNKLHLPLSYEYFFVRNQLLDITYSAQKSKYLLALYSDFDSEMQLMQGHFSDSALVFDDSASLSEAEAAQTIRQYTFSDINSDSFTLTLSQSADGGKTWADNNKFVFEKQ